MAGLPGVARRAKTGTDIDFRAISGTIESWCSCTVCFEQSRIKKNAMKTTKKVESKQQSAANKPKKPSVAKAGAPISRATGRRKTAVARVWLRRGKGAVTVNGKPADQYFETDFNRAQVALPLSLIPRGATYDVDVNVKGGGPHGQAGAVKLGIARALVASDESMKAAMRRFRLLTVDSRVKERKKYGQRGARRKFQFVKR